MGSKLDNERPLQKGVPTNYWLTKKLWGEDNAIKVGWILALFPTLILYSVLTLREVYSCFFILVAMIGVVNWVKFGGYKSIVLAMTGFIGATFFHGVLLIGGIFFLIKFISSIFCIPYIF